MLGWHYLKQTAQNLLPICLQELKLGYIFKVLPANFRILLGFAQKMRDIRSASWVFKARIDYIWYFSVTKGLLQLIFWHGRAQSQVPATPRKFYPKLSRKWKISIQHPVLRRSSSTVTVPVTVKQGRWLSSLMNNNSKCCPTCPTVQTSPLSLIHIWRCRRLPQCRSRWSPYH